jgi:hypothetical protein
MNELIRVGVRARRGQDMENPNVMSSEFAPGMRPASSWIAGAEEGE